MSLDKSAGPILARRDAGGGTSPGVADEDVRLAALQGYDILDTPREETFDRITRLAKRLFDAPMVSITLVDGHRQWFKSQQGLDIAETPRGPAFCNTAMRGEEPLLVADASVDPRFADNPYVTGDPHIRFYAGAPLRSPDGHALGALCVIDRKPRDFSVEDTRTLQDLAQIVMDELELRKRANTDTLTGAQSRRAFHEEATRALHLARRHDQPVSLIVFDLDHFKQVNDLYGHPVGDMVLTRSVAVCTGILRASDSICRLGGEEFGILLPQTSQARAMEVAERLRAEIGAARFAAGGDTFQITASFGVSARSGASADIDSLIAEADAALYLAKAQGRNRCVAARPPAPVEAPARRRVLKGGRIIFNRGQSTRECTVKALGESGATIEVSTVAGLPHQFMLAIEADDMTRSCRIVRGTEKSLEVDFV